MRVSTWKINGSPIRNTYRATTWTRKLPVRLFVTVDDKIWVGYGDDPDRFCHVGNVGDRDTKGYGKAAIREAANS